VEDFLLFARPGDPQLTTFPADALLHAVKELLGDEVAKREIDLRVETHAGAPPLRADANQLKQVLINLIINAAESISGPGCITLRVRRDELPLQGNPQKVVVLEVQDTGSGIPPEVRPRLFDPFFTTKPSGTGLGLSMAIRVLERHGGTLQYQTEPGCGTRPLASCCRSLPPNGLFSGSPTAFRRDE
jgi:signal transduction histidine kinase